MNTVAKFVNQAIKTERVLIFSKSYCPYCAKAKALLTKNNLDFTSYELDKRSDGSQIQDYLFTLNNQKTVPSIYINQTHVGGSDDLTKAFQNGTVKKLLK
ncbi:glutaredoxin-1 [Globomyces pollinis-pini]|nr:glutaredoxin-1 [Globomyces pollinis-pini]